MHHKRAARRRQNLHTMTQALNARLVCFVFSLKTIFPRLNPLRFYIISSCNWFSRFPERAANWINIYTEKYFRWLINNKFHWTIWTVKRQILMNCSKKIVVWDFNLKLLVKKLKIWIANYFFHWFSLVNDLKSSWGEIASFSLATSTKSNQSRHPHTRFRILFCACFCLDFMTSRRAQATTSAAVEIQGYS